MLRSLLSCGNIKMASGITDEELIKKAERPAKRQYLKEMILD
jgi:hypothetical protein